MGPGGIAGGPNRGRIRYAGILFDLLATVFAEVLALPAERERLGLACIDEGGGAILLRRFLSLR